MSARTLLVGGLSSLHDPLLAASLRGVGLDAVALHPRTDRGLRRARGLGNHGQCNPAHYAVGAILEHAERSGLGADAFAARHQWVTVSSCGPCRLAAFRLEYSRVLEGAGLSALPIVLIEQLAFVDRATPLGPRTAGALLAALVAGDVLAALGHRLRPWALEPEAVEALLADGSAALVRAFEERKRLEVPLRQLATRAAEIRLNLQQVLPRILLVGEPWTTLADGDPSYDLARRLELAGVEVDAPRATDWLRQLLWEQASAPHGPAIARADRRLCALFKRFSTAAGLEHERLDDPAELAALAAPWYAPAVRGGSGHLEVGRTLRALRDRSVHLVLSLKPFGCLPSSALSDGILSVLLRARGGVGFLALETTGDADASVDSRVEMALQAAVLAVSGEVGPLSATSRSLK